MPSDDDSKRRVPLGPVGRYVIANLKDLREARGLNYKQLAERLEVVGRPIPTLGLSRIEKGERRVDADDLVALAVVLGVNPSALLLPRDVQPREDIYLIPGAAQAANDAWAWADGTRPLPAGGPFTRSNADWYALADFARHGRPQWSPPRDLEALTAAAQQPKREDQLPSVATAIVVSSRGVLVGRRHDGKPPWTFIAGEVEEGETPEFAAAREVKEETGLEARARDEIGRRIHPRTGREMIYIAAEPVRADDLEVFVGDSDELADVRWVSLAEADELMAEYGMYGPVHEYLERELGEG